MAEERRVIIERKDDGCQYSVTLKAFESEAERFTGFTILSYEDGTPYEAPQHKPAAASPTKPKADE